MHIRSFDEPHVLAAAQDERGSVERILLSREMHGHEAAKALPRELLRRGRDRVIERVRHAPKVIAAGPPRR